MEKERKKDIINKLLIHGINNKYSRVSANREDEMKNLIELLYLEPSILEEYGDINEYILLQIFSFYKEDISSFLRKNLRKIENKK
jgi:hypothetical protein